MFGSSAISATDSAIVNIWIRMGIRFVTTATSAVVMARWTKNAAAVSGSRVLKINFAFPISIPIK